jgi:aminobenzoyl-glutamate utilization protein B
MLDLFTLPEALKAAQKEFRERTGGGIDGKRWVRPLLPRNFRAPINYRWPEYITTERGTEWWIPEGA